MDFSFAVGKEEEREGARVAAGGAALGRCGETRTSRHHQEIPGLNWKLVPRNFGVGKLISDDSEICLLDK